MDDIAMNAESEMYLVNAIVVIVVALVVAGVICYNELADRLHWRKIDASIKKRFKKARY